MARRTRRGRPDRAAAQDPDQPRGLLVTAPFAARLRPWLPLLAVVVLLAILYPEALFQGQVFGAADTAASEAFRQVGDEVRARGEYPLWNPFIFGGMPTFGSLAYTVGVYPPTLVIEFLQSRLGLPPLTWMLLHLAFGGLGMWWLLGRWHAPWASRLLACVAWLWFARVVAWGVHGHGSKLGAAMYLPWLLGLTWTILVRGNLRATALAALLLGLQFLRGHPQISYYTLLLLGALAVWSLCWPLGEPPRPRPAVRWRRAGLVFLAIGLGFALGSVLLLSNHDYAALSTRGAGGASGGGGSAFDYATSWSLAPEDLQAAFLPAAAGFGKATYMGRMPFTDYPNYAGLLLPLLAAAAWLGRRRSLAVALAAISLLAVLVGMGRFSPGLYQFAYAVLPYFDKLRIPSMILVLPACLGAVLAGLGSAALVSAGAERPLLLRRAGLALLVTGAVLAVAGVTGVVADPYRESLVAMAARSGKQAASVLLETAWSLHRSFLLRQGLVLLAAGGAVLLAGRRPAFRQHWLVPVLAVLVAVDLGGVARLVTHPEQALVQVVRTADGGGRLAPASRLIRPYRGATLTPVDPQLADLLQGTVGHGRLLPLGSDATANEYMTIGVRSLGGYYPAKMAAAEAIRQRLFGPIPSGHLARWLGAQALTYPGALPEGALPVLHDAGLDIDPRGLAAGGTVVYTITNALPRARLVDAWQPPSVLPAGDALEPFLDAVASGEHDIDGTVVLDREPRPAPQAGDTPLPVPEFVVDGLNEVVLKVETPRPALLLLADLMAPGWRAAVDGEDVPLLTADLVLRAVALPEGTHEVRFSYHDPAVQRGLVLAVIGLLGMLVLLAASWRWDRNRATELPEGNEYGDDG